MTLHDLWTLLRAPKKRVSVIKKTDDERIIELEERKNEAEITRLKIQEAKRLRQQRDLDEIRDSIEYDGVEEEESDEEDYIEGALATAVTGFTQKYLNNQAGQNFPSSPQTIEHSSPAENHKNLSDDDIRELLDANKQHLKLAKKMPKEVVKRIVSSKIPVTDEEFDRAHKILLTEY